MLKIFAFIFLLSSAYSHEGPPYPILMDQKVFDHRLSIWADPDVGEGTFQFFLEDGESKEMERINVEIRTISPAGVKDQPAYKAKKIEHDKLVASIPFSVEGLWTLVLFIKRSETETEQVKIQVEVTPPGPSKIEFMIYTIPFFVLAFFWIKIFFYKRSLRK